jgi:hypothetical protein
MMLTRKMRHPDPDPLTQMNPDLVESASFSRICIYYNQPNVKLNYGTGTFIQKISINCPK